MAKGVGIKINVCLFNVFTKIRLRAFVFTREFYGTFIILYGLSIVFSILSLTEYIVFRSLFSFES